MKTTNKIGKYGGGEEKGEKPVKEKKVVEVVKKGDEGVEQEYGQLRGWDNK